MASDTDIANASTIWESEYAERLIGSIRRDCLDHVILCAVCWMGIRPTIMRSVHTCPCAKPLRLARPMSTALRSAHLIEGESPRSPSAVIGRISQFEGIFELEIRNRRCSPCEGRREPMRDNLFAQRGRGFGDAGVVPRSLPCSITCRRQKSWVGPRE